ncbi:MAG: hypothetical protein JO101_11200 [Candidatus Eremiobacteraeota bacterium]|nr:hypothetical protein [Candidatus Eremiobacteraeota bacterium]
MSGFRSSRAIVAGRALVDDTVKLYGRVVIGERALIEAFCLIGHPCQADIDRGLIERNLDDGGGEEAGLDAFYDRVATAGTQIEAGTIVRSSSVIYDGATIREHCDIAHSVVVRESATVGPYTRVLPFTSIRRGATIGRGCHVAGLVSARSVVGDYVSTLGFLVHEYTAGVSGLTEAAPVIRSGVIIGRTAAVVGGVTVGEFALVAAGAIVRADVEPNAIVAGDPARIVGRRSEEDILQLRARIAAQKWG